MTSDELRAAAGRTCQRMADANDGVDFDRWPGADRDAYRVAVAYQMATPADDGEPVTAAWLESQGWGVTVTRTVAMHEAGDLRVSAQLHDGVWHMFGRRVEGDCSLRCHTRGHVRRLLAALGVTT